MRNILAFEGEEVEHRAERNVYLLVVAVGVAAADSLSNTDDLETVSVERDEGADRGAPGKEELVVLLTEDDNLAALGEVILVEKAPLCDGEMANFGEVDLDAHNGTA